MPSPAPYALTTVRPRRFLLFGIVLVTVFFFFIPWEIPPSLKDAGLALSRANIAQLTKSKTVAQKVDEIYGLLHLVTAEGNDRNTLSPDTDPSRPVNLSTYAAGDESWDWHNTAVQLNSRYPIIVFSKSYCGYSQRAKALLEAYDIQPRPKYIEVDLREDSEIIKEILSRLTRHSTFPNIIISGQSIGGFDDLQVLHAQQLLTGLLEKAGTVAQANGPGK